MFYFRRKKILKKNIPAFIALLVMLCACATVYFQQLLPEAYLTQLVFTTVGLFVLVVCLTLFLAKARLSPHKSLVIYVLASMVFTVVYFTVFIAFYLNYAKFNLPELVLLLGNFVAFKAALIMQLTRLK